MMTPKIFRTTIVLVFLTSAYLSSGKLVSVQAQYDIKEMTPEVKAALENRRVRYDKLREFKAQGMAGETNRGYVDVLTPNGEVSSLVDAENSDRRIIYQTIAQQNNLSNAMATIEKVFAQVQRDKANPGDKIQNEDGSWIGSVSN